MGFQFLPFMQRAQTPSLGRIVGNLGTSKAAHAAAFIPTRNQGQKQAVRLYSETAAPKPTQTAGVKELDKQDVSSSIKEFSKLGLSPAILAGLYSSKITQPTQIQKLSIPRLLQGQNAIIAAETGSGKTLAYSLPLLNQLALVADESPRRPYRPKGLVIVPNLYLCQQAYTEAKKMSAFTNLTIGTAFGRRNDLAIDSIDIPTADIIFGTTAKLLRLHEKRRLFFSDLKYVVVDEAEFQTSEGYEYELNKITDILKLIVSDDPKRIQVVYVTATLISKVTDYVKNSFPNVEVIKSDMLHRPVATLNQKFIPVLPNKKHDELLFWMEKFKDKKVIIFCNTIPSAQSTCYFLEENKFPTIGMYGDMPMRLRKISLKAFSDGTTNILVCTDIASRGLDIPDIYGAILFDFPKTTVDYLHRIGRVARAGNIGHAVSFVTKQETALADTIKRFNEQNRPLDSLMKASPIPVDSLEKQLQTKPKAPQPKVPRKPKYYRMTPRSSAPEQVPPKNVTAAVAKQGKSAFPNSRFSAPKSASPYRKAAAKTVAPTTRLKQTISGVAKKSIRKTPDTKPKGTKQASYNKGPRKSLDKTQSRRK